MNVDLPFELNGHLTVCLQILLILTHQTVHVNQTLTSPLGSTLVFQNKSEKLLQNKSPYFLKMTLKTVSMNILLTFNRPEAMTRPTRRASVRGPDQRCLQL